MVAGFCTQNWAQRHETTAELVEDLLAQMEKGQLDFTNTFADLDAETAQHIPDWNAKWHAAKPDENTWRQANPRVIPRTHKIEEAIKAATDGDFEPFHTMLSAVSAPFAVAPEFMVPPEENQKVRQTFCGT